jgi:hypothetical protein
MRKLRLLIGALAGLALALAACGAGVPAVPVESTRLAPLATSTRVPTATSIAAASLPVLLQTSEPASCTAAGRQPTPGPTEISLFPGVNQADWKLGPDGAKVVIIEYGDFQ